MTCLSVRASANFAYKAQIQTFSHRASAYGDFGLTCRPAMVMIFPYDGNTLSSAIARSIQAVALLYSSD